MKHCIPLVFRFLLVWLNLPGLTAAMALAPAPPTRAPQAHGAETGVRVNFQGNSPASPRANSLANSRTSPRASFPVSRRADRPNALRTPPPTNPVTTNPEPTSPTLTNLTLGNPVLAAPTKAPHGERTLGLRGETSLVEITVPAEMSSRLTPFSLAPLKRAPLRPSVRISFLGGTLSNRPLPAIVRSTDCGLTPVWPSMADFVR